MTFFAVNKSLIENLQLVATSAAALITFFALIVAIITLRTNQKTQREQTARNAYIKYLELTLTYPDFAFPVNANIDIEKEDFGGSDDKARAYFSKYEWFLSIVLNTCSFIWETLDDQHVLSRLAVLQIAYHWKYLDHYKENKNFVKLWMNVHNKNILDGIEFGKNRYSGATRNITI